MQEVELLLKLKCVLKIVKSLSLLLGKFALVFTYICIKDEPAPSWPPVTITSDKLCNGDWNRRLKVEIFDYNDR